MAVSDLDKDNKIVDSVDDNKDTKKTSYKKKIKNFVRRGIVVIKASFNNTRVTITDKNGNVLCWVTAGKAKFKGSSKSTSYAAQVIASEASRKANQSFGMAEVDVLINGPGPGRESAVRGVVSAGLEVLSIKDVTPIPHNGCRPPKKRRM